MSDLRSFTLGALGFALCAAFAVGIGLTAAIGHAADGAEDCRCDCRAVRMQCLEKCKGAKNEGRCTLGCEWSAQECKENCPE